MATAKNDPLSPLSQDDTCQTGDMILSRIRIVLDTRSRPSSRSKLLTRLPPANHANIEYCPFLPPFRFLFMAASFGWFWRVSRRKTILSAFMVSFRVPLQEKPKGQRPVFGRMTDSLCFFHWSQRPEANHLPTYSQYSIHLSILTILFIYLFSVFYILTLRWVSQNV